MEGALLAGESLADDPGVPVDQNAHGLPFAASATTLRAASVRSVAGSDGQPAAWRAARAPARRWCPRAAPPPAPCTPTFFTALMTPSAIRSQRTMPPKILTSTARTRGLERISSKAAVTRSAGGAAADVQEVRRLPAVQLDQVHGRHGKSGAVHHAGDVAVEGDVVEIVLARAPLHRIFLAGVAQRRELGVAEQRVGIDVDLGIERQQRPGARDDQRIHLDQAQVLVDVQPVERRGEGRELGDLRVRRAPGRRPARAPGRAAARPPGGR